MRRQGILLALLIGLIAVAVAVSLKSRSDAPSSTVQTANEAETPAIGSADAMATTQGSASPQRDAVPTPPASPAPPGPTANLTVRVVDANTKEMIQGALVEVGEIRALSQAFAAAHTGMHEPEGRRIRARLLIRATTDEHGEAHLVVPERGLAIEARLGELWGMTMLANMPQDGQTEVAIGPDRELSVQVVDASGAPRAGIPVAVRRQQPGRLVPEYDFQATSTEKPRGVATFLHLQRRFAQGPGWHATFAFPCVPQPCVPIDESTPSSPPLQLVLPPTGSLRVVILGERGIAPDANDLRLEVTARANGEEQWNAGPWQHPYLDERGQALVPFLGLGLDLTVTLKRGDRRIGSRRLPGPGSPGETVVCELGTTGDAPLARGRFVRRDGTPWPACTVTARSELLPAPTTWPDREELVVDASGRFSLPVRVETPTNGTRSYVIRGEHPALRGTVACRLPLSQIVPPEGVDLGDVVFDHGPLLLAGSVVDVEQRPLAQAQMRVFARTTAFGGDVWPHVECSGILVTGADGRFALFLPQGDPDPGIDLQLEAKCPGYVGVERHPRPRGDEHITLVMQQAGSLAGSLRFADDRMPRSATIELRDASAKRVAIPNSSGEFRLGNLRGGTYSLVVHSPALVDADGKKQPITVEGVVIVPGETCRDPRIQDLRIESLLHAVRVTIVDRASTPVDDAWLHIVGAPATRSFKTDRNGTATVLTMTLPVDLDASAFGYRPQRVQGVAEDTRIVVDTGIEVRLHAGTAGRGSNPHWELGIELFDLEPDGTRGGLTYGEAFPHERRFFDGNGELALRLPRPGTYECQFFLFVAGDDRVGRGAPVKLQRLPRITVVESTAPQVFELDIPAGAITTAVAAALK
ncbi:MAG: carboxypeptidase-like regulatory domain-containing protein [Planctomycetota bacterium]